MNSEEYKTVIRLLRGIVKDAINLKNNFQLSDGDIRNILAKEELLEELVTESFVQFDPLGGVNECF